MTISQARSYNDNQLDTLSRSVFYQTLKKALDELKGKPSTELMEALAESLDAASCGFKEIDEDDLSDIPAGMRQSTPYNDDLLNEMARDVYVKCLTEMQKYIIGTDTINHDRLHAYARLGDAAACGFKEDDDE